MVADSLVFIFALIDDALLLSLTVYFVITLSDLECDYLNARSCCGKLNKWVLPEIVAHGLVSFSLIISGHWILFCLYSAMTAWVIYTFVCIPSGNIGMYDPAEIHNRQQLKNCMRECLIKLVFHLVFFFVFLYNMILSLLTGEPEIA
ncbi:protein cornichon homolog 4 [Octopus bimaculoides]|uniref:Cornichon n=1 Tax=Octopus bimaculoides TaxID=37653 RepID=A0A0L8GYY2_OCTBM|nr:protein cornichon homolog 4 [Octopus bimaculoides]|eukprot:XP_014776950.1 PREDICTED: protein cornichon homolog 4-like [Octopus bimaculoides]